MVLLIFAFSFFIANIAPTSQTECPMCNNDCGEVGFLNCDDCQCSLTCDMWPCGRSESCVLEAMTCDRSPCPKLPSCVNFSHTCKRGSPLYSDDSPILCDSQMLLCPPGYSCTEVNFHTYSVCCPEQQQDDGDNGCRCEYDLCEIATCPPHPKAHCVHDECSCESWFIDENAQIVDCVVGASKPPMPPFPPPDFGDFPLVPPRPYPSPSTKSTNGNSPDNLGSHGDHVPMVSDVTLYVIVGCSAAVVTMLIVLVGYKFYRDRQKKTSRPDDEEEQLKPLQTNGNKVAM